MSTEITNRVVVQLAPDADLTGDAREISLHVDRLIHEAERLAGHSQDIVSITVGDLEHESLFAGGAMGRSVTVEVVTRLA